MQPPPDPQTDDAETLASVRRGLADIEEGRVLDLEEAFAELNASADRAQA